MRSMGKLLANDHVRTAAPGVETSTECGGWQAKSLCLPRPLGRASSPPSLWPIIAVRLASISGCSWQVTRVRRPASGPRSFFPTPWNAKKRLPDPWAARHWHTGRACRNANWQSPPRASLLGNLLEPGLIFTRRSWPSFPLRSVGPLPATRDDAGHACVSARVPGSTTSPASGDAIRALPGDVCVRFGPKTTVGAIHRSIGGLATDSLFF